VNSETAPTATEKLTELRQRVAEAQAKVDQLEAEQRAASEAREAARAALIDAERRGVRPAERTKLESALTTAEARTEERWPERIAGARARISDCELALQGFVAENLRALVEEVEARGDQAAADEVAAAGQLLAAYNRREACVGEIGALVAAAGGRVHPADVGPPSRADAAAAECRRLVENGEPAPRLRHYPGEPRHGAVDPPEAVPA
jgi:chromosome segregation ATPase